MKLMSSLWKMADHWNGEPVQRISWILFSGVGRDACTVDLLASSAMAVFGIQWLFTAQLVFDLAAMTAALVADLEIFCFVVNSVRWTVLPLVKLALGRALVTIVAVGMVGGVGHVDWLGVEE